MTRYAITPALFQAKMKENPKNFQDCDFYDGTYGADLEGQVFRGANLRGANFSFAFMPNGHKRGMD
jgi:uncharacterized protein YjbI with pentapeptide repeats